MIFNRCVIASNRHIRNAEFKIIYRPIFELRLTIRMLFFDGKIGEQNACRIGSDKDENVPESVQVWKIGTPPRVTVKFVRNPAAQGQPENGTAANAQPINAHTFFTKR